MAEDLIDYELDGEAPDDIEPIQGEPELYEHFRTVVEPSGSTGFTAFMAAFSIKATSAGVANTSISPEPSAKAVLVEFRFTSRQLLERSPLTFGRRKPRSGFFLGSSFFFQTHLTNLVTNALFLKHAQVVYEDRPFQMIHFVLNTDSQQPVAFQFKKVAFEILTLNLARYGNS